ncbi:hypothetical protein PV328_008391 [Microctonus aethiopoides]|uniref:Peptidase aspartic putative domain-containing protein n=1 Tax=Microctonus aethiopoides TaxID=144406 RepID=A0AA39FJP7_9HYME|nr:hypothetical protein PV328_008391 [Microctonus aethiopoides]
MFQLVWTSQFTLVCADPEYSVPGPIDIIIGADTYGLIIHPELIKQPNSLFIAQSTIFSWVILGPITETLPLLAVSHHTTVEPSNQQLLEMLQKIWQEEETQSQETNQLCPEDPQCEDHFRNTRQTKKDDKLSEYRSNHQHIK